MRFFVPIRDFRNRPVVSIWLAAFRMFPIPLCGQLFASRTNASTEFFASRIVVTTSTRTAYLGAILVGLGKGTQISNRDGHDIFLNPAPSFLSGGVRHYRKSSLTRKLHSKALKTFGPRKFLGKLQRMAGSPPRLTILGPMQLNFYTCMRTTFKTNNAVRPFLIPAPCTHRSQRKKQVLLAPQ